MKAVEKLDANTCTRLPVVQYRLVSQICFACEIVQISLIWPPRGPEIAWRYKKKVQQALRIISGILFSGMVVWKARSDWMHDNRNGNQSVVMFVV